MLFGWILFFFIILFNSISEAFGKSFLKCYLIALCMFKMINNSFLSRHGRLTSEHIAKSHIPVSLSLSPVLCCRVMHGENVMLQDHVGYHAQSDWKVELGCLQVPLYTLIGSQ